MGVVLSSSMITVLVPLLEGSKQHLSSDTNYCTGRFTKLIYRISKKKKTPIKRIMLISTLLNARAIPFHNLKSMSPNKTPDLASNIQFYSIPVPHNKFVYKTKKSCLSLTGVSDPVGNATMLHVTNDTLRQASRYGNGIYSFRKTANSLPFTHPTIFGAHYGNYPAKIPMFFNTLAKYK